MMMMMMTLNNTCDGVWPEHAYAGLPAYKGDSVISLTPFVENISSLSFFLGKPASKKGH